MLYGNRGLQMCEQYGSTILQRNVFFEKGTYELRDNSRLERQAARHLQIMIINLSVIWYIKNRNQSVFSNNLKWSGCVPFHIHVK